MTKFLESSCRARSAPQRCWAGGQCVFIVSRSFTQHIPDRIKFPEPTGSGHYNLFIFDCCYAHASYAVGASKLALPQECMASHPTWLLQICIGNAETWCRNSRGLYLVNERSVALQLASHRFVFWRACMESGIKMLTQLDEAANQASLAMPSNFHLTCSYTLYSLYYICAL